MHCRRRQQEICNQFYCASRKTIFLENPVFLNRYHGLENLYLLQGDQSTQKDSCELAFSVRFAFFTKRSAAAFSKTGNGRIANAMP